MNYYVLLSVIYCFFGSLFLVIWRLEYIYQYASHNRFGEGNKEVKYRPDTSLTFALQDVISFSLIGTGFLLEAVSLFSRPLVSIIPAAFVAIIELVLVFIIGRSAYVTFPDFKPNTDELAIGAVALLLSLTVIVVFLTFGAYPPLFPPAVLVVFFPVLVGAIYLVFVLRMDRALKELNRLLHGS